MDIVGFIHIGNLGRWREIYESQLALIKKSGLYDRSSKIYVGVSGNEVTIDQNEKLKIFCYEPKIEQGETTTIRSIHSMCNTMPDSKIWYVHTKGAMYTDTVKPKSIPFVDSWREYLQYFIIEKHDICISKLDNFDICGTEFRTHPTKHFSGNFWWANSSYVKNIYYAGHWLNGYALGTWVSKRHCAELGFIGVGEPKVFNFMNLHNGLEAYNQITDPKKYKYQHVV